ncbi:MlaA family lipoprotein [Roseicella aquatilis]|uniref:VacJ family lipoprotein n=1 Tax=Roseicella aquatilis TaxID=2527868 RepID=A0A4R4D1N7_9PROT|nr:MlaA family lipoprotein [Roseicella aquatilis]TCZ50669.1 hypothetical protein EXY23_27310 [Roseicella aquatilis]
MAAIWPAERPGGQGRRAAPRLLLALALLLAALPARAAGDPFETVNRRTHAFNQEVQARLLGPVVETYHAWTTPEVRQGVATLFATWREPVTAASGLAAADWALAWNAAARFGINATLGWGGVRDAAAALGYPRRSFTPADALCAWGVPSGPFVVLPLLGPSTLRDAGAMAASSAALAQALGSDAVLAWSSGDALVEYAGLHAALRMVERESLDSYAVLRSAYRQRRAATCAVDRAAPEEEP